MIDINNYGNMIEGFKVKGTHTAEYGMWLVERYAPTPQEKEILESVPFMQGEYDFSSILGARVYNNRQLSYKFEIINTDYQNRKNVQTSIENWLMNNNHAELHDDHALEYTYYAKCTSVNVTDAHGGLSVDIEFTAYPFKRGYLLEGNDIWDSFNFLLDVSQTTEFVVNGTQNITLYNAGANLISPVIIASSEIEIVKGNQTYIVQPGETKSVEFALVVGENNMTLKGNGSIEFRFRKELL